MATSRRAQRGVAMIAGHFAFAAAVKSRERAVPLWALMLATQWLDVVFVPLFVRGIETIRIVPGLHAGYGTGIIYADYTHSLVGALVLSVLFGLVAALRWDKRSGVVLAGVVFSHWLIDLVVHRGDMPLLPDNLGGLPRLGLGLWRIPQLAAAIECLLVVAGAYLYWRAALQTAQPAGTGAIRRAHLVSVLILAGGIAVLGLDVLGI